MHFALRQGIRVCVIARSAICLDIASGRYFAIDEVRFPAFARWWAGEDLSADDIASLRRLLDAGVLITGDADAARPRAPIQDLPVPATNADTLRARPGPLTILSALVRRLIWSWRVRHWRFERLIVKISRPASAFGPVSAHEAATRFGATVRAFDIGNLLLGSHDRCLALSLALTDACRKQGLAVQLVIAVQAAPFAAHCWVQHSATILNEKPDRAHLFTPILVA